MRKRVIVDTHCDTIKELLDNNEDLLSKNYNVNLDDLNKISPYIQTFAAFIHSKYVEKNEAFARANKIIDKYYEQIEKYNIKEIKGNSDVKEIIENNLIGSILSIENLSAIDGKIENIEHFYKRGVKMMGLVWNDDNDLASGALTKNDMGLTKLR